MSKHAIAPGPSGGATWGAIVAAVAAVTTLALARGPSWGTLDGSSAAAEHAASKSAVEIPVMQEEIIPWRMVVPLWWWEQLAVSMDRASPNGVAPGLARE